MQFNNINELKSMNFNDFRTILFDTLNNKNIPELNFFKNITALTLETLQNENPEIRPYNNNLPGGLINLTGFEKIIILPDLHARRFFFKNILNYMINDTDSILDCLEKNSNIALLCLGDGVHGEANFASRWLKSYEEYKRKYDKSPNMDMEISNSFNLMISIMLLKIRYTDSFHFLKGNHENIYNETGNGNYAFAKYANEGDMVLLYFRKRYDEELLSLYSKFEKNLPLFVVAKNFLASHSEPSFFFDYEKIINFRNYPELIEGLTWTDNFSSFPGTVDKLISYYIPENSNSTFYFGGHRPIKDRYFRINNDRYVQIHNPKKEIFALIDQNNNIDLEKDIKEIIKTDEI